MRSPKTALFVAAEFPPIRTIGRLRTTKFIEHLRGQGWDSVVLTIEPNEISSKTDPALLDEVPANAPVYRSPHPDLEEIVAGIAKRILGRGSSSETPAEPAPFSENPAGSTQSGKSPLDHLHATFKFVRQRALDVPDSYNLWAWRARTKAVEVCRKHDVDLIFTTLPPFSAACIGRYAKRKTGVPWVVDYRDLWTGDVLREWLPSWRQSLDRLLERRVIKRADAVVAVSEEKMAFLRDLHGPSKAHWAAITNGYDPEEFEGVTRSPQANGDQMTFTFTGRLFKNRQGYAFAEALGELSQEEPSLAEKARVRFLGGVAPEIRQTYDQITERYGIKSQFEFMGDVPHKEAKQAQVDTDYLLLIVDTGATSDGVIPGKLFEYVGARRPIFALCDPGATAKIIERGHLGTVVAAEDTAACKVALRDVLAAPVPDKINVDEAYLSQFERSKLAERLAQLFDQVVETHQTTPSSR